MAIQDLSFLLLSDQEHRTAQLASMIADISGYAATIQVASDLDSATRLLMTQDIDVLVTADWVDGQPAAPLVSAARQRLPNLISMVLTLTNSQDCFNLGHHHGADVTLPFDAVTDDVFMASLTNAWHQQRRFKDLAAETAQLRRQRSLSGAQRWMTLNTLLEQHNSLLEDLRTLRERAAQPGGDLARATFDIDDLIVTASDPCLALVELLSTAGLDGPLTQSIMAYDLVELIEDCLAVVAPEARGKSQHILFSQPMMPLMVKCAPIATRAMVLQLLLNAVRHTPRNAVVRLDLMIDGAEVFLSIYDDGPGLAAPLSAEDLIHPGIDQAMENGDVLPPGATGLQIASAVARAHGGMIDLQSEPGEGVTQSISLPLLGPPSAAQPEQTSTG